LVDKERVGLTNVLHIIGITLWALALGVLGLFAELCIIDLIDDLYGKSKKYKEKTYREKKI
jgi:hypothetical protein